MTDGFIKNYDLIQEDCRVEDLLDFSESITAFSNRLETIDRTAIIGLIGKFGTGKSTMLYQIQKEKQNKKENKEIWINFDAWKYPERKDLWEGFVLDFADQVGNRNEVQKKIDGKDAKSEKVDLSADLLLRFTNKFPSLKVLNKFIEIFKISPATRVFDIQNILTDIINKQDSNIFIVVEDIDRSGDSGVFFLETLKQFLRDSCLSKKVIVVVPMGEENYEKNIDSYLKCIDYFEFFNPKHNGLEKFVESVFEDTLFEGQKNWPNGYVAWSGENNKGQIISFLDELIKSPTMTIRLIKIILRKAELVYKHQCHDGHEPDWRVTICFEASKYLYINQDSKVTYFDSFKKKRIVNSNTIFATFLSAMILNHRSIYDLRESEDIKKLFNPSIDISCITRLGIDGIEEFPSIPWLSQERYIPSDAERKVYYNVCDFYMNY